MPGQEDAIRGGRPVEIAITANQYALVLKAFGLHLRPVSEPYPHETDLLLFGPSRYGNPRPPLVAGWYEKGTDLPGWYSADQADDPINMVPTHWLSLTALDPLGFGRAALARQESA